DIYLKYKNPTASSIQIKGMNYTAGLIVVGVSIVLGIFAEDVNSILQWIVSVLYGSYVAANVLKWYWWRFNGEGFFWGMVAGLVSAGIVPELFPDVLGLYLFPVILLFSIIGSIVGTYVAPPTNEEVLKAFYKNVRPWGFWKPIHDKVVADDPGFEGNKDFWSDMLNVTVGIVAQTVLVVLPMYLIFRQDVPVYISLIILVGCAIILKKNWWDKLEKN